MGLRYLTAATREAWAVYEAENEKASAAYIRMPAAKPLLDLHHPCLCCDVLTTQFVACLSCQARSEEWRELAADEVAAADYRRAVLFPMRDTG